MRKILAVIALCGSVFGAGLYTGLYTGGREESTRQDGGREAQWMRLRTRNVSIRESEGRAKTLWLCEQPDGGLEIWR
jgi:hypothetical protein